MAKLEARVSTLELLEAIRTGATKNQLIKKYRTSESELASVLHPLFRNRKMTAEEFNNFFKGVPITRSEDPLAAESGQTERTSGENTPSSRIEIPLTSVEDDILDLDEPMETESAAIPEEAPVTEMLPIFSSPAAELTDGDADSDQPVEMRAGPPTTSAGMSTLLEMIFSKLTAIDTRLAEIERKIQG